MATETTYTCDRCSEKRTGHEARNFLEDVAVFIGRRYTSAPHPDRMVQWCRPCLIQMGLRNPAEHLKEDALVPDPAPTLEEILREIVREEIQCAT